MGFWFHFISNLFIPLIMLVVGTLLFIFPPKKINNFIGYRTTRSMQSLEAWMFAQKHSGLIMAIVGLIMLIVTIVIYIPYYEAKETTISTLALIFTFVQLIVIMGSVMPTEIALKKKFDNK